MTPEGYPKVFTRPFKIKEKRIKLRNFRKVISIVKHRVRPPAPFYNTYVKMIKCGKSHERCIKLFIKMIWFHW